MRELISVKGFKQCLARNAMYVSKLSKVIFKILYQRMLSAKGQNKGRLMSLSGTSRDGSSDQVMFQ